MHYLPLILPLSFILLACGEDSIDTSSATPENKTAKILSEHKDSLKPVIKQLSTLEDLDLKNALPSDADIDKIMEEMPDFNRLMDGMIDIAENEELRDRLKSSADRMKNRIEESGALKMRENGRPDLNAGIETLLRTLSDEEGIGEIVETLEDVAAEMSAVVEESLE